ncbi:hypothetical protein [Polymorphobacter fuscus]|uniref:Uncharacterized protein n=1 Tax=Sandarakinorhabdus fusca TaxID=1439888 RepID=A0A7C9GP12_9SPHN|nr:hypothetical protein [Polymorphobacter fuscus]KAB7647441.1 hypothetical protein F9290_05395 [Polymorphobacter fuscus]MQT16693.1 hypothetical protein [Polymorphobacter fuscus]NJC09321.1 hypothetical protein [Polymorphobacter fuscus]
MADEVWNADLSLTPLEALVPQAGGDGLRPVVRAVHLSYIRLAMVDGTIRKPDGRLARFGRPCCLERSPTPASGSPAMAHNRGRTRRWPRRLGLAVLALAAMFLAFESRAEPSGAAETA